MPRKVSNSTPASSAVSTRGGEVVSLSALRELGHFQV